MQPLESTERASAASANTVIGLEETLVAAIQRFVGSSNEDYIEDTIVGSDINQIRHLFFFLNSEKRTINVNYQLIDYRASILEVGNSYVRLRVPDFVEGPVRRCRLKFEVMSVLYQFEVGIQDVNREELTILIPYFIQSAQRRRYRRIPTDDLYLRFNILYQPIYGRSNLGQYIEARFRPIINELKRDEPNLYLLNRMITDEIMQISPNYEIRFYMPGESLSFREQFLRGDNQTLYLKDTVQLGSYHEPIWDPDIITYSEEFLRLSRKGSRDDALTFFRNLQQQEVKEFLYSYIYSPVQIFDTTVGHIHLYSTLLDRTSLTLDHARLIHILGRLFSRALSKTVIARSYFRHSMSRIINMSMGGLLFEVNHRQLFEYLLMHDHLKLLLQIQYDQLEVEAEINRCFPSGHGYNIGVRFQGAKGDEFRILERYLFERSRRALA